MEQIRIRVVVTGRGLTYIARKLGKSLELTT